MLFGRRPQASTVEAPAAGRILSRGQRTVVREFTRADVDRWVAWPRHRDPLFESYNAPQLTARQRDLYFEQRSGSPDSTQYAVEDLRGDLVGRISLREIDWRLGASVLGVSFHPGRLNEGLGTDALRAFLEHYFGPMRMSALFLDVAAFNRRAYRVYEKCGFRRCGQRWGDAQPDQAGVFRKAELASIRHLFQWEYGLIRPLLIDMVARRPEWERRRRFSESREAVGAAR
jgi:RimJ/RimL family protein N-acetyltransferase